MKLEGLLTFKSLGDAEAGELILLKGWKGACLAIVLEQMVNDTRVALLSGSMTSDWSLPCHTVFERGRIQCLSYGHDWVIDAKAGAESYPGNVEFTTVSGALYQTPEGPSLILGRPKGDAFSTVAFDLKRCLLDDTPATKSAPFLSWKIWAPASDLNRAGVAPLFSFEHKPQA